jgi:hypothetical protein
MALTESIPEVTILRMRRSDQGTVGIVIADNVQYCYSLELPWRENRNNISCIPPGKYKCEIRNSPRFGNTYWVKDVPGRQFILIHSGNWAGDINKGLKTHVNGCILFGKEIGYLAGQLAILNSRITVKKFMNFMNYKKFKLEILENFKEE